MWSGAGATGSVLCLTINFRIWLGNLDSNQDKQSQSLLCYRYTIPQRLPVADAVRLGFAANRDCGVDIMGEWPPVYTFPALALQNARIIPVR